VHDLALGLDNVGAAERALLRHPEALRALPVRACRADDLRDDITRPLNDDVVPLADLLAVDVLLVVESRARNRDASNLHRLEHRPRVERPGASDPDEDLVEPGHCCHRRPLVGARPAGPLVERAETFLLREGVDLDDEPVDLVVELDATLLPVAAGLRHRLDGVVQLGVGVGAEAVLAKPQERVPVPLGREAVSPPQAVDPDGERAVGRDRGVLLAQRPCRSVARVRRRLLPLRDEPAVELVEAGQRQVHLSTSLEDGRRHLALPELHAHRDRLDRLQVHRHVLAAEPVTPRRAAHENAALVEKVDGETVDLRLGDVADLVGAEALDDIRVPLLERLVGRDLLQRAHRRRVLDLRELVRGRRADTLRRAIRRLQVRMLALEGEQLFPKPVELGVRDLRCVEDVVAVQVVVDDLAQLVHARRVRLRGHRGAHPANGRPCPRPRRAGGRRDGSCPRRPRR
jgi:hypothetical protein